MKQKPVTNIRIDPEVKQQAVIIFSELGMSLSTAITVFLRAAIRENGLPFEMKLGDTVGRDE